MNISRSGDKFPELNNNNLPNFATIVLHKANESTMTPQAPHSIVLMERNISRSGDKFSELNNNNSPNFTPIDLFCQKIELE